MLYLKIWWVKYQDQVINFSLHVVTKLKIQESQVKIYNNNNTFVFPCSHYLCNAIFSLSPLAQFLLSSIFHGPSCLILLMSLPQRSLYQKNRKFLKYPELLLSSFWHLVFYTCKWIFIFSFVTTNMYAQVSAQQK